MNSSGSVDVLGKANAPAATTANDLGKASPPQGPSDKEVSAQSELEKKVDASVSSFIKGQNPADGTEEPLDAIKKDIVASLKELENSEDADPVLLSALDTAASLIAANPPEVDQNPDGTIQAATVLPDGSTKSLRAKKDSNDNPAAPSDKPNEPAEAKETQGDAAKAALGKLLSSEEADVSSGKTTDSSANPATPNEVSKDTNPAPLHTTAKETIGPGPLDAANKGTVNSSNSDATTTADVPAGLGPNAQKHPVPKILIEAASDATDDDRSLDIPPIQTVPSAMPAVSAIPSEVIPEIAENVDEPETPKLPKQKLYLRKMRCIILKRPVLNAALGRQLANETKRKLEQLAKGEPYGLSSEVPDVADPVDAGATDLGDSAEIDANATDANATDATPSATDATDSPKVAADPVDAAPGTTDPADSAEVDKNATDPTLSATDATDSPKVAADPVDAVPGATDPADSAEIEENAADPAPSAAADPTDSSNVSVDPADAAPGAAGPADSAEVDANAADPAPGAANHTDSSNVAVDPVDAASGTIGPPDSAEVDANVADLDSSAAADATDSSNVAVGPINSASDASDTTGSDAINSDAADPAPGAVGAPSLPKVAADTAKPAPAAADTSDSVLVPETTDSAQTAANASSLR